MEENESDLILQTNCKFTYEKSGNYDKQIMIFFNQLFSLIDKE